MVKKNSNIKIGLVGLGYWGKNILRNLYELGVLETVCDSNPKVIKERKKDFPSLKFSSSYEGILKNPKIKAIVIATPAATHYELTKKALNANKDVFVEKPLALGYDNGKELVTLAKEKNKILMVGHILQYHPAIIKLKGMVKKGDLGKLQYICSNRLNIGKLRVEENILWSFAPHDISAILALTEEEPLKINSFGESYLSEGVYDVTLTTLEFKNNVKAHIFVSWLHPYKEQKLIIVGTKAMAVFDDLAKDKLCIYPHKIKWENGRIPVAYKAQHYPIEVANREPLKEEMKHFIECVSKRKTPQTDGIEGLKVLKVLEEAEKSIVSKGESMSVSKNKGYFVHSSSCVDENVKIGKGTKIWNFSHILEDSKIGKNCIIGQNVMIGPEVTVGNGCKIQNNVSIYKDVTLEDDVFCGPSCVFTNVINPRAFINRKKEFLTTLVKKGATIGANATIVCGNNIGSYAFIGSGAVVTKDVPNFALVYGNPARLQGWMCECGVKLQFEKDKAVCKVCNKKYKKINNNKIQKV